MGRVRKSRASHGHLAEDDIRNQEVLRANRELARGARGAEIIKAFIRERERADPAQRRPLPIAAAGSHPSPVRATGERASDKD
jgi:hypothetical protein